MTIKEERVKSIEEFCLPKTPEEKHGLEAILAELTEEEKSELTDPGMPLRHLRAEKLNVKKAIKKLRATLAWRKEYGVAGLVESSPKSPDLRAEHESGKRYIRGYDSTGSALLYYRSERENTFDWPNNVRSLVWSMEKALACSAKQSDEKPPSDKVSFVLDMDKFQTSKLPPFPVQLQMLHVMQDHYPERLEIAYVVNPSFVFRTFWKMFRPFVDQNTRTRVIFCTGDVSLVNKVPDPSKLEQSVGGTNPTLRHFDIDEYCKLPFDMSYDE